MPISMQDEIVMKTEFTSGQVFAELGKLPSDSRIYAIKLRFLGNHYCRERCLKLMPHDHRSK